MKETEIRRRANAKQKARAERQALLNKEPEPEVDDSACVKFLEEHFDATLEALRYAIY